MSKTEKVFPLNTFGGRIQDLRKNRLKISRPEFYDLIYPDGNVANESKSRTVKNWESGDCEPDLKTITQICIVLRCSSDYLLGLDSCTTKNAQFIHDYTGLSEDALNTLRFIKKLNMGKIFLYILSRLIENRDFSCNLMSEINSCFEKYYSYDNNQKLLDSLDAESGDDIIKYYELINSDKYQNIPSRKQIEELRDAKDSKIYRTHVHFLKILDSFLSNRIKELNQAPNTN